MTKRNGEMCLGASLRYLGYHLAAWRHPNVPQGGTLDIESFVEAAQIAEKAKMDMIFFADGVGIRAVDEPVGSLARSGQNVELEPLTMLSAIAMRTSRIGLVATASTTYNEPFHIARKFASLDHISRGRAGWNVVTSWSEEEAKNFGRDKQLDYETRYSRAGEFVNVVTGLWDSWDDDAFVRDRREGICYDESKLHVLNHKGEHFSVRGPLSSARTPQGRPVIVQAGNSDAGREIAAKHADVVYTTHAEIGSALTFYGSVKDRLAKYGRSWDSLKILPALTP